MSSIIETVAGIAEASGYRRCRHSEFRSIRAAAGHHRYKVHTVTTKFVGFGDTPRKSYFYVSSIAQLRSVIEEGYDWTKDKDGYIVAIKNNYQTAFYVDREY